MQVLLVGAGGHAREIASYVADLSREMDIGISGVAADWGYDACDWDPLFRQKFVGGIEKAAMNLEPGFFLVGVGDASARQQIADLMIGHGWREPKPLVHPTAYVARGAQLDDGSLIFPHARVGVGARIARQVHVTVGATIGHESVVGVATSLFPGSVLSGNVTIGDRCTIGTGALVLEKMTIESDVTVGAGAVVTRPILEPKATVVGTPARPIGGRRQ